MNYPLSIIVGVAIGGFISWLLAKGTKEILKNLENVNLSKFERVDYYKNFTFAFILAFVLSVLALFSAVKLENYLTISLDVALIICCIAEFIVARITLVFYYNDERFIIDGKQVPYKTVKKCEYKNNKLSKGTVTFYNGSTTKMNNSIVKIIDQHLKK